MSCGHGCGHGYHVWDDRNACFHEDWPDDPRYARRDRTAGRVDEAPAAEVMERQLAGLHGAIRRLEAELAELRARGVAEAPSRMTATEPGGGRDV